jgi:hypothetical protein
MQYFTPKASVKRRVKHGEFRWPALANLSARASARDDGLERLDIRCLIPDARHMDGYIEFCRTEIKRLKAGGAPAPWLTREQDIARWEAELAEVVK